MNGITYKEAIIQALAEAMERDEDVFLIGEDVGVLGGAFRASKGLLTKFGEKRVMDTPISEAAIVGYALGAALAGLRPVAEIMFIDFTGACMDQIINQVAKVRYMLGGQVNVPLVIRTQGGFANSWAAQHSQSLESFFCHVPGLKVVMPSTPRDAKGLLTTAIAEDDPVIFIEHKLLYSNTGPVPDGAYRIPLGVADVKREGSEVTILSYSRMVLLSLEAAASLQERGISAEVVDLRTLDPLDADCVVASVKKTGRVVIATEEYPKSGYGAELASFVMEECFDYLDAPVKRVAARDVPVPFSKVLEDVVRPNVKDIVEAATALAGRRSDA